ncbi:3-deoxy-D-manno-octulosonate 8-phosphate phosphatase (KDO 8-P phosphatase) [Methanolobus vulcani]|uniref:3-deoxy-D-manno-octulosonate 8-phosphate phosphatase (KDO 8-P phosphatase) n=1 Tax=Methanolobus vulcani TaxID=38026 RepID=A0A7Z7B0U0_9EURY|nr:HAD-IIIA family hydrolase [Methanolobus vulcani]SDF58173.1 3-deoxy-D-manno-octulosonate 8-phosphate phosphatase (KDO 8-P phosphatase) [Methanolobus vulcani]
MSEIQNLEREGISAILMDVDGVLTNGTVILGNNNAEFKEFNVRDGMAISIARRCGIKIGFITSRQSEAVELRGKELNIDYLFQDAKSKLAVVEQISSSESIPLNKMCYIGDDVVDVPVLKKVGFPATVKDAPEEIKSYVSYVSAFNGGEGAVRDIIKYILSEGNRWQSTIELVIKELEADAQSASELKLIGELKQ